MKMKRFIFINVFFYLLYSFVCGCTKDDDLIPESDSEIIKKDSVVYDTLTFDSIFCDTIWTKQVVYDTITIDSIVYDTVWSAQIVYDTIKIDSIVYDTIQVCGTDDSQPYKFNVFAYNTLKHPLFVAHRGYIPAGPQNSIPAFIGAGEKGFWGIETDLRITKDKVVVCMHDPTLEYMTDGRGKIIDYTYEELLKFKLKDKSSSKTTYIYDNFTKEELRIPTLDDYLSICSEYKCIPFIDLKVDWGIIDILIEAINRHNLQGKCYIISSNLNLLKKVRQKGCMERILLMHSDTGSFDDLLQLGNSAISFSITDCNANISNQYDYKDFHPKTPSELMQMCHKIGLGSLICGGDDMKHAIKSIEIGVDYMFTNYLHSLSK